MISLYTAIVLASQVTSTLSRAYGPEPFGFFVNNTIYQPPEGESVTYPRFTELTDGTILATTSLSGHSPGYFPVFESGDGGASWEWISNLEDTENGWGMSAQPALAELTEPIGGFDAGTILASGNSWSDAGTRIDLYASTDRGRSWEFVSQVAEGGRPNTTNGADPIWEPYLLCVQPFAIRKVLSNRYLETDICEQGVQSLPSLLLLGPTGS